MRQSPVSYWLLVLTFRSFNGHHIWFNRLESGKVFNQLTLTHLKNSNIEDEKEHEDEDEYEVRQRNVASYVFSSAFALSKPNSLF